MGIFGGLGTFGGSSGIGGILSNTGPNPEVHGPFYLAGNASMTQIFWGAFSGTQWVRFAVAPVASGTAVRITEAVSIQPDDGVIRHQVSVENVDVTDAVFNILLFRAGS